MESGDFRRVITNGLGRAVVWLQSHPWEPHRDAIEHVCLNNTAYDPQCEGGRAEYAFKIVSLTSDPAYFANMAARGLIETCECWHTSHLYDLNCLFAQAGHAQNRDAIYEKFKKNDADERFIGREEFLKLDGFDGFIFVLEQIGEWSATHPEYWEDDYFLRLAERELSADAISKAREAAEGNLNIRRYFETVEKHEKEISRQPRIDFRKLSYSEVRDWFKSSERNASMGRLFGWGKNASEDSIRLAAADLLTETDETSLIALARIFNMRAFPRKPDRLIELASSNNKQLAKASLCALRHVKEESVRELALDILQRDPPNGV